MQAASHSWMEGGEKRRNKGTGVISLHLSHPSHIDKYYVLKCCLICATSSNVSHLWCRSLYKMFVFAIILPLLQGYCDTNQFQQVRAHPLSLFWTVRENDYNCKTIKKLKKYCCPSIFHITDFSSAIVPSFTGVVLFPSRLCVFTDLSWVENTFWFGIPNRPAKNTERKLVSNCL